MSKKTAIGRVKWHRPPSKSGGGFEYGSPQNGSCFLYLAPTRTGSLTCLGEPGWKSDKKMVGFLIQSPG